jgi:hypothetical protein
MLTANEIELVRASFAQVVLIQDTAADLFYDRLFAIAPNLRRLFPVDIEFKGPLSGPPQTAVLYGDPTKPGVFVSRVKFPADWKESAALASGRGAHSRGLVRNALLR